MRGQYVRRGGRIFTHAHSVLWIQTCPATVNQEYFSWYQSRVFLIYSDEMSSENGAFTFASLWSSSELAPTQRAATYPTKDSSPEKVQWP